MRALARCRSPRQDRMPPVSRDPRLRAHRREYGCGKIRSRPSPPMARQLLPFPRGLLAFEASLIWLPSRFSAFAGAFGCFGLRISRLLRFCPLAMAKCPFEKSCTFIVRQGGHRFETILGRHAFVALVVAADAILERISLRRKHTGDVIEFRGLREGTESAFQANALSQAIEVG